MLIVLLVCSMASRQSLASECLSEMSVEGQVFLKREIVSEELEELVVDFVFSILVK